LKKPVALKTLNSFTTVIATLGGPARTGELIGKSSSYVCNWRRVSGKIPPKYYLIIQDELALQGFTAADRVFGFAPRVRKKRVSYCDYAASMVIVHESRLLH
jgi:hypothetical protein